MGKSVIIIGAGIAGLSAGVSAQINGYTSEIYESHSIPGGLCTSWKRGDYTFDGCLDWLTGSAPDGMFYPLWKEAGAMEGRFIYHDAYCVYLGESGERVTLYFDPKRLKQELLSISPEDSEPIGELCDVIDSFLGFKPNVNKAPELFNIGDYLKMMPGMMVNSRPYRMFFKYGKITMGELGSKFKNPSIRSMLTSLWTPGFPVSLFAATMAWCASGTAGYPEGGSLQFAQGIEKKYLSLGGTIHYNSRVEGIIVENDKAVGVTLADGTERRADHVISAADGYTTLEKFLGGSYTTEDIKQWYSANETFPPYIQVSLGVKRDMKGEPKAIYRKLAEPITIAGSPTPYMIIHVFAYDTTLAPEGKTPVIVRFFTDFDYWQKLYADKKAYKAEKEKLANDVIRALSDIYPGIESDIEVTDVATPPTYVRYTGNWKGATMSWLPTTSNFGKSLPKVLPGLKSFYMAGQWLVPGGGVPNAFKTGREAVQHMCKADKKKFN